MADPQNYAGLAALFPLQRHYPAIIPHVATTWMGQNVLDPVVMIDPKDASKLLMWFGGIPDGSAVGEIGRATAAVSDPYTWTMYGSNPILGAGGGGEWDAGGIRLDCVLYNSTTDEFWMYYSSETEIGLAISPGNDGITFTKYVGNPIFSPVAPETHTTQCAVIQDDATHWYMYYSHRDGATILPDIKLATSADGVTWAHTGTVSWAIGAGGTYDDTYKEHHQILKLDKYILIAECYDGANWTIGMASCDTPDGTFVKETVAIHSPSSRKGTFDRYQVATPWLAYISGRWYLFYQGEDNVAPGGDYTTAEWDLGVTTGDDPLSLTLQLAGSHEGEDATLISNYPTYNAGAVTDFNVGNWGAYIFRSLIYFDLSSIPSDAHIVSATLSLWLAAAGNTYAANNRTIQLYRVKREWIEGTHNPAADDAPATGCTWNRYDLTNTWTTAGCDDTTNDREATSISSHAMLTTDAANSQHDFALSVAAVQEWVRGAVDNNGLIAIADTETGDAYSFASSDHATAAYRPKLVVDYTLSSGGMLLLGVG